MHIFSWPGRDNKTNQAKMYFGHSFENLSTSVKLSSWHRLRIFVKQRHPKKYLGQDGKVPKSEIEAKFKVSTLTFALFYVAILNYLKPHGPGPEKTLCMIRLWPIKTWHHNSSRVAGRGRAMSLTHWQFFFNRERLSIGCIAFKARCFGPTLSICAQNRRTDKNRPEKNTLCLTN